MRKMKKINGYLVVRFNDRERRDYETLGAYGVIDAELYTGHLEVDRGALEYDDAETMEQAIEQARGLESELDVEEPEAAVTVIVETELGTTELETTPEELLQGEKRFLETRRPALSQEAADWQLCGYVRALTDLGIVDSADERFQVPPPPPVSEPLEGFRHLPPGMKRHAFTWALYQLGQKMEAECPDNDCIVYRNTFRMARELDTAMDEMAPDSYPALTLRRELRKLLTDLQEMYSENYAVCKYRGVCPPDQTVRKYRQHLGDIREEVGRTTSHRTRWRSSRPGPATGRPGASACWTGRCPTCGASWRPAAGRPSPSKSSSRRPV